MALRRWSIVTVHAMAKHDTHPTVARASSQRRARASVSKSIQELCDSGGWAFPERLPVCGAKPAAGQSGRARGAMAMGFVVGAGTAGRADEGIVGTMADAHAAGLAGPGESAAGRKGTGRVAPGAGSRATLWARCVGNCRGQAFGDRKLAEAHRPAAEEEEAEKRLMTTYDPFSAVDPFSAAPFLPFSESSSTGGRKEHHGYAGL